jgi:ABC-2 type transport system ATP-binding protein
VHEETATQPAIADVRAPESGSRVASSPGPLVIEVEDARKSFGEVKAVDGVSFHVGAGEIFGLLGPNGAGKTTTIEMLEGLSRPDGGTLRVLGLDVTRDAVRIKQRIGVQLQTAALYPHLTVDELMRLFSSFYAKPGTTDGLIDALGLNEKRRAQTRTLSGGQQQRLSVALALVNNPELVFLDEPTTGMDPAARRSLWDLIRGLQSEGRSVLMTTHYMEEAEALCDRLAIMDHGKILEMGTVDEIVGRRFHERAVQFDRLAGLPEAELSAVEGVTSVAHEEDDTLLYTRDVPATIGALLELTESKGLEPKNLLIRRPSLEDVFLALTGRALRE